MPFEEAYIVSSDGVRIHAWLVWAPANVDSRRAPTIVFCHANAGNMGLRLPLVGALVKSANANVLVWDYRGYGASGGEPGEEGMRLDSIAIHKWLAARNDIDGRKVFWYGQSLGGAVAAHALADLESDPSASALIPAAGLILENTFTSIPDMVDALMPAIAILKDYILRLKWNTAAIAGVLGTRFPTLFISGLADALVPPRLMAALHETFKLSGGIARARGDPAAPPREPALLKVPNAGHNDVSHVMGDGVWGGEIGGFIVQTLHDKLGPEEAFPKILTQAEAEAVHLSREMYLSPMRLARVAWLASGAARARLPQARGVEVGVGVGAAVPEVSGEGRAPPEEVTVPASDADEARELRRRLVHGGGDGQGL